MTMNPALQDRLIRTIDDKYNDSLEAHETIKLYIALDEKRTPRDVSIASYVLRHVLTLTLALLSKINYNK